MIYLTSLYNLFPYYRGYYHRVISRGMSMRLVIFLLAFSFAASLVFANGRHDDHLPLTRAEVMQISLNCMFKKDCITFYCLALMFEKKEKTYLTPGIYLSDAQVVEKNLSLTLRLPYSVTKLAYRNGRSPRSQIIDMVTKGLCQGDYKNERNIKRARAKMEGVFDWGASFRIRAHLPNKQLFVNQVIKTCNPPLSI